MLLLEAGNFKESFSDSKAQIAHAGSVYKALVDRK